jgi:hypothetical protein
MTRKKVVIQARELSEMDVNIISLVKRGANRIPFRIVKSDGESTMNISNLFVWKQEPQPAAVVACVLAKTANHDAYTKALEKGGFPVDHVTEGEDGTVTLMFTKSDEMTDAVALKVSEDAALIVVGVEKGLLAFPDSNSFIENITKAGFAPSYHIANEILNETVGNIIFSEGDAEETKGQVQKAIEDFGGYIDAILSTIPVQAFKAEEILEEVQKGLLNSPKKAPKKASKKKPAKDKEATAKQEDEEDEDAVADDTSDADDSSGADENGDDESGDDESGDDENGSEEEEGADDASEEAVSKDPKDEDKDDAIAAMSKSLSGIAEGIEELKTSQTDAMKELSDRLTDLEAKVKKTDEALAGTVNSEEAEDSSAAEPKKKDVVKWDNLLDFGDVEIS